MKKIITIILLSFLCSISFRQLARADFLESIVFSNKSYAENIKTEGYLLTNQKTIEILLGESPTEIILDSYSDINLAKQKKEGIYLVVRIKNIGNQGAWGELIASLGQRDNLITVNFIGPNSEWEHYIIPVSSLFFPKDKKYPKVTFSWGSLYAK